MHTRKSRNLRAPKKKNFRGCASPQCTGVTNRCVEGSSSEESQSPTYDLAENFDMRCDNATPSVMLSFRNVPALTLSVRS